MCAADISDFMNDTLSSTEFEQWVGGGGVKKKEDGEKKDSNLFA